MIPEHIKTKEQYDKWFNEVLDKAMQTPISEKSTEDLIAEYKEKYKF